jgi:molecular chaperone DnaK (HSP70)
MTSNSKPSARYLVGIDLGTTHTVVAYAALSKGASARIEIFPIEQLVAPGEVAARPLLPSVRYHPAPGELTETDTRLPWPQDEGAGRPILGELARALGAKTRGRLIASAKSWLSHGAVDRTAPILPWGAPEEVAKVSPVEASASYLSHVRSAWNHHFPDFPLERQEIVVTVPASFDEAARSLTLEAARLAGLTDLCLVEEPQAACYDWLWQHRKSLAESLAGVRLLLVVDVGGGTTDLTLIKVEAGEDEPQLTRIGVGNHLMLGGDNIDLTLAHLAEQRLVRGEQRLSTAELSQLVEQCRAAKERLLCPEAPESAPVTLLGAGSRLIGGARSTELRGQEVRELVLDGFFPLVNPGELPDRKRSGVVEFGLPYAPDPAISKHIAAFLTQHRPAALEALDSERVPLPDTLLLNGGVFNSPLIAERLVELLASWRGQEPKHLRNDRPDRAVACGAVAYGLARHGLALRRIGGGSARSYFLLIDTDRAETRHGVCLLPRGSEEGHEVFLTERTFALRLGQPVRFHLVSSIEDTPWQPGDLVEVDDDHFAQLPPLAVAFDRESSRTHREVAVQLVTALTEIGTLRIQCVEVENPVQRWDVEFHLRQRRPSPSFVSGSGLHPRCAAACTKIQLLYGKKAKSVDPKGIKGLRSELEKLLGKREDWDTPLLRELFAALLEGLPHRRRSAEHERVWMSLTGFCLRPGFGYPLDEQRVEQIWGIWDQSIQFVNEAQNWAEWWTLWRRIAAGLSTEAQDTLFTAVADFINPEAVKRGNLAALSRKRSYEDMVRLAAVLERVSTGAKIDLGGWLLQRLRKPGEPVESWWALGRVGARVPFHGSAHGVVPRETAEEWLTTLLEHDWKKTPFAGFAAALIARMSGDRERDIENLLRQQIIARLRGSKAPDSWTEMVAEVKELNAADEKRVFGEALPPGLKLLV